MDNGKPIDGIGIVQWIFQTFDTNTTIQSHCYHIPNAHAHLLSPQQLFSTRGGATGTFTISDKCATLSLDGKPSLKIPYDSNSYLPVSLSRNATESYSPTEVNMSVLSDENNFFTPSQKFLLLWQHNFGHRNMQFIQHMFLRVHPFPSPKLTGSAKYKIPKFETCEYVKA